MPDIAHNTTHRLQSKVEDDGVINLALDAVVAQGPCPSSYPTWVHQSHARPLTPEALTLTQLTQQRVLMFLNCCLRPNMLPEAELHDESPGQVLAFLLSCNGSKTCSGMSNARS